MLCAVRDFVTANCKDVDSYIIFCFKLGKTYTEMWEVQPWFTVWLRNQTVDLSLENPSPPHLKKARQVSSNIKIIIIYISNKMQCYRAYFIWRPLHACRVVPPPIIRSANICIYSIWYLSHRYCYLLLSCKSWNNSTTIVAGSSNGVTNTRCCRYSCLRSWWWVVVPHETCRAVSR